MKYEKTCRVVLWLLLVLLSLSGCEKEAEKALGTLEWDRVNGRAPAGEVIVDVFAEEGEYLNKGMPILGFDDRKIQQQLVENRARLRQAEWRLMELENGARPQDIAKAEAQLKSAQAALKTSLAVYRRQQKLQITNHTSQQELDNSRSAYIAAKEKVHESEQNLSLLREGPRKEQIQQARAEVAALASRSRHLQLIVNDYIVRASRSGLLESLPYKKGDKPPAMAVVSTLLVNDRPWARVYIPQPYRSRMEVGDTFTLTMDGEDTSFPVELRYISSRASFTPYFALSERDRSHLCYVAEFELTDTKNKQLTAGTPVQLELGAL